MAITRKPRTGQSNRFRRRVPSKCSFCVSDTVANYKETTMLKNFMTDKGKIVARSRTGICQKHQKALSVAIKHARHMGLLPYVTILK